MGNISGSKRCYSVEILRCLLMFLIVQLHCYVDNTPFTGNHVLGLYSAFFVFTIWHVDAFVGISGYFGIKFKLSKVIRLIGLFLFYGFVQLVVCWLLGESFSIKNFSAVSGWFGGSYLLLMFLAPLLNIACQSALEMNRNYLKAIWFVFAIGMFLSWFPPLAQLTGCRPYGGGPLSILTMIFVYMTARVVRLLNIQFSGRKFIYCSFIFVLTILGTGTAAMLYRYYVMHAPVYGFNLGFITTYDSPHVVLMAIAVLLEFLRLKNIPEWVGRVFAFIAPSMFPIYLLHLNVHNWVSDFLYRRPEMWLLQNTKLSPLVIITLVACSCFTICLVFDLGRRLILCPFKRLISSGLSVLDAYFDKRILLQK